MAANNLSTSEALAAGVAVVPPPTPSAPLSSGESPLRPIDTPSDIAEERKDLDFADTPRGHGAGKDVLPESTDAPPLPGAPQLSTARLVGIAAVVTCTMCLGAAGAMGLIISLPTIQVDLQMLEVDLQWVSSVYSLTAGCFLLLSGRIADIFGRKKVSPGRINSADSSGVHCWSGVECDMDFDRRVHEQWYSLDHYSSYGRYRKCHEVSLNQPLTYSTLKISTPSAIGIIAQNFKGRARSTAFAAFSAGAPVGGGVGLVIGGVLTAYTP